MKSINMLFILAVGLGVIIGLSFNVLFNDLRAFIIGLPITLLSYRLFLYLFKDLIQNEITQPNSKSVEGSQSQENES